MPMLFYLRAIEIANVCDLRNDLLHFSINRTLFKLDFSSLSFVKLLTKSGHLTIKRFAFKTDRLNLRDQRVWAC